MKEKGLLLAGEIEAYEKTFYKDGKNKACFCSNNSAEGKTDIEERLGTS